MCANCGAALQGEYCSACGQRHEPHVHSLMHFAGEAFESISHADSRLWRTLWLLVSRPGRLTREFFAGHRASYLPPFRLYLVLSVLCFLVAGLPGDEPEYQRNFGRGENAKAVLDPAKAELPHAGVDPAEAVVVDKDRKGFSSKVSGLDDFCSEFGGADPGGPGAHARANIRHFCVDVNEDVGVLGEAVVHNLPRAMFIFLPLLAALMKLLYWRPKRYYVEHLLFLVHNHAFVFVAISVLDLMSRVPVIGDLSDWLGLAIFGYMFWYIYRAMRDVYGQGRALTISKYLLLGFSYVVLSFVSLLLALMLSVMLK